jgi:radical SAM superfamily enzyme YgiQ (UPF0313 family)
MRVLLMVPLKLSLSKGDRPTIPDLGLGYLASALKKEGHEVFLHDWNKKSLKKDFLDYLRKINPEVIGLKVFTKDMADAVATTEIIRHALPEVILIVGGPHPSASPPNETMADFIWVDFALQGDAEKSLPMLLKLLSQRDKPALLKEIPGLIWRDQGQVSFNPNHLNIDLDSIGFPDWELINPVEYLPPRASRQKMDGTAAPISITRGCPAKCIFCCAYKVNGCRVRARSPQHVLEEVKLLYHKYQVRHFFITDTNFLYYKELVEELCQLIIKEELHLRFDTPTGPRWDILDDKLLPLLRKAGCNMIGLGIESGSPRIRKLIKKEPEPLEDIKKTVDRIRSHQIGVAGYFMLGFPEETLKDIEATVDLAFSLKLDHRSFEVVYPLPGTPLYEQLKAKYGLLKIDWQRFDITDSPYPLGTLTTKELNRYLSRIYLKMLFNPRFFYQAFLQTNTLGSPKLFLKRALQYRW